MSPAAPALNRSVFWAALMLCVCITVGIKGAVQSTVPAPWWWSFAQSLFSVFAFMFALWWAGALAWRVLALWLNDFKEKS